MIGEYISVQLEKINWNPIYDFGLILGQISAVIYLIANVYRLFMDLSNGEAPFIPIVDIAWCFAFFALCKTVRQIKHSNHPLKRDEETAGGPE